MTKLGESVEPSVWCSVRTFVWNSIYHVRTAIPTPRMIMMKGPIVAALSIDILGESVEPSVWRSVEESVWNSLNYIYYRNTIPLAHMIMMRGYIIGALNRI